MLYNICFSDDYFYGGNFQVNVEGPIVSVEDFIQTLITLAVTKAREVIMMTGRPCPHCGQGMLVSALETDGYLQCYGCGAWSALDCVPQDPAYGPWRGGEEDRPPPRGGPGYRIYLGHADHLMAVYMSADIPDSCAIRAMVPWFDTCLVFAVEADGSTR